MSVKLRDGISIASSDIGAVLLDEQSGKYWQLNRSGALILRTLLDGEPLSAAVRAVTQRYEVDEQTAGEDASELYRCLRENGLVDR